MNTTFTWVMQIGSGNTYPVTPIYKDDLALEMERESQQIFFRRKLSGGITFVRKDALLIINAAFTTEFTLYIYAQNEANGQWLYYTCHFYKTDCTIDEYNKIVSVQPSVRDSYQKVLDGLDREFDLIKLTPVCEKIDAAKRPFYQIWCEGSSKITNVLGNNIFFEQDAKGNTAEEAMASGFFNVREMLGFSPTETVAGMSYPLVGGAAAGGTGIFRNTENIYYMNAVQYMEGQTYKLEVSVYRVSDNHLIWEYEEASWVEMPPIPDTFTMTAQETGFGNITMNKTSVKIYSRYVCDVESITINGQTYNTQPITVDDFAGNNRGYHYRFDNAPCNIEISTRYSTTPTEWGLSDNDVYFLPPDENYSWHPIAKEAWTVFSIWVTTGMEMSDWLDVGIKYVYFNHTYPIWSVLSVLLRQIDNSVYHGGSNAYSIALYDTTNPLGIGYLAITPKSNILAGDYETPAQTAPITLGEVLSMLRNAYQLYWFIDEYNNLRIEHISWFKNGGSYNDTPTIGYDLTSLENKRNGKKWSFAAGEYKFNKDDMPQQYIFEWMDKVSLPFTGYPLVSVGGFVKQGKNEEIHIGNFTPDIDLMMMCPDEFSMDGFALLSAEPTYDLGSRRYIGIASMTINGYSYKVQNFRCCMFFMQPSFWLDDAPSWTMKANEVNVSAHGIMRMKNQEITFPIGYTMPDTFKLVKTMIGNGEFGKVSINLSSLCAKVTLKYNTYEQE